MLLHLPWKGQGFNPTHAAANRKIPLQLTIDIQNKKIPIQELTSALKGIEAAILGRVLEEIDSVLISSICGRGYGRNEYHKHSKEERTIVTQQIDRQNILPPL